jgi:hypothetical protein
MYFPAWHKTCLSTELKQEEAALRWLLRTLGIGIGKTITLGEYERIKNGNRRQGDYGILVGTLGNIVNKRSTNCQMNEVSKDCPIATVLPKFYQKIINIQEALTLVSVRGQFD